MNGAQLHQNRGLSVRCSSSQHTPVSLLIEKKSLTMRPTHCWLSKMCCSFNSRQVLGHLLWRQMTLLMIMINTFCNFYPPCFDEPSKVLTHRLKTLIQLVMVICAHVNKWSDQIFVTEFGRSVFCVTDSVVLMFSMVLKPGQSNREQVVNVF